MTILLYFRDPNSTLVNYNLTRNKMNLFVLSGHGSESFAAFLNGVILQKNNAAVITAAGITTHHESELRFRTRFHAPTIQTNSFCFGSNITVFPCPMSIYKFIFILSRNPFYQQHLDLKMRNFDFK